LLCAWNVASPLQGGAGARPTATVGATGHDRISGYRLATMFAVNDPGLVENLPAGRAPDFTVMVTPAPEGGWNVVLDPRNFTLALPIEYDAHVPGRAHVHLWIDGDYVDDFVTPMRWVPPLPAGTHEIVVNIATVDHRLFARDGVALVERTFIRGGAPHPRTEAAAVAHAMALGDGTGALGPLQVRRGDLLRLDWSSTAPLRVSLHGYEMEAEVGPLAPASFLFVADLPGTFAVENRSSGTTLLELTVLP
jgi:hypothetical protein